ncbi:MAG: hypothetical protein U0X39_00040 [Bacteroidales bacterium]
MKRQVVIVSKPENDWVAEKLLIMARNNFVFPFFKWMFNSDERRQVEKGLCDKINMMADSDPGNLEAIRAEVSAYQSKLESAGLGTRMSPEARLWIPALLIRFLGLPFFIAGYVSNLIPYLVPRAICNTAIKDLRFYSSVYIAIGTVLYLVYLPVVMALCIIFLGWPG